MTCRPKRPHSPTASSTIEVLALAVGGGASGCHDEAGQGPSGGSPAALLTAGLGADVQAAAATKARRMKRRMSAFDDDNTSRREKERHLVAHGERPLDLGTGGEQQSGGRVDGIFHVRAEIARLGDRAGQ